MLYEAHLITPAMLREMVHQKRDKVLVIQALVFLELAREHGIATCLHCSAQFDGFDPWTIALSHPFGDLDHGQTSCLCPDCVELGDVENMLLVSLRGFDPAITEVVLSAPAGHA